MTRATIRSAALAAALLALPVPAAPAADPAPPPIVNRYGQRIDLRAELTTEAQTSFRGSWHYRLLIANYGATQLICPCLRPEWGIYYIVTDSEGRPVRPAEPIYPSLPLLPPQTAEGYISLSRGELHGFEGEELARQLFPGPGTYRVLARIRPRVPASFAPSEEVWTSERAPLDSNTVTVTVVP